MLTSTFALMNRFQTQNLNYMDASIEKYFLFLTMASTEGAMSYS